MREEEAVLAEHWWRTQAYGASAVKVTREGVELVDLPPGAYQRGLDELGVVIEEKKMTEFKQQSGIAGMRGIEGPPIVLDDSKDWGVLSGLRAEVEQHRERLFNLEKLLGAGVEENFKLVEAVFKARIEALAALRRFTALPIFDLDSAELTGLFAADERLQAAQEALAGKT